MAAASDGEFLDITIPCVALLLIFCLSYFIKAIPSIITGLSAFILLAFLGYINYQNHLPLKEPAKTQLFKATVVSYPEEKENSIKQVLQIMAVANEHQEWKKTSFKSIAYFPKHDSLYYGDEILVKSRFLSLRPPRNPEEFDYRKYLLHNGISAQLFLKEGNYILINKNTGNSLISIAFSFRNKIENIIDAHYNTEIASILKALLIGVRSDMDDELTASYAAAGAIHVLAVSGLHVGIVYGILLMFFGSMRKRKVGKYAFAIIALLFLWFYALVTGFSPSILRAVLMFSFIIISQAINRGANIYNSIAASAFILLCYDPLLLMNVGFQLSYLAVIGIVYFYPRIVRLYEPGHLISERIWQMTVVGIAAQISTLPLVIFYFHQFPTYFFISNLVVIPLATAILWGGILFVIASPIYSIATILAGALSSMILFMNACITLIERLPFSTISPIYISFSEFALFGAIIFTAVFISQRHIKAFYITSIMMLIFIMGRMNVEYIKSQRKNITFYSTNNETAIDFMLGKQFYSYQSGDEDILFSVSGRRLKNNASIFPFPDDLRHQIKKDELLIWEGKKIYIKRDRELSKELLMDVDVLLILDNSIRDFDALQDFDNIRILIGTDNGKNYRNSIIKFALDNDIIIHDLSEQALVINL